MFSNNNCYYVLISSDLHLGSVLYHIRKRYKKDLIYVSFLPKRTLHICIIASEQSYICSWVYMLQVEIKKFRLNFFKLKLNVS